MQTSVLLAKLKKRSLPCPTQSKKTTLSHIDIRVHLRLSLLRTVNGHQLAADTFVLLGVFPVAVRGLMKLGSRAQPANAAGSVAS